LPKRVRFKIDQREQRYVDGPDRTAERLLTGTCWIGRGLELPKPSLIPQAATAVPMMTLVLVFTSCSFRVTRSCFVRALNVILTEGIRVAWRLDGQRRSALS
jgi:hypothetical protein